MGRRKQPWKPRRGVVLAFRRSAVLWWTASIALGLVTAGLVSTAVGKATRAADAWGSERAVWVVRRALDGGDVIRAEMVRRTRMPRGVVPDDALNGETSPVGEATRVSLVRGEIVLVSRLAGRGAHGIAAMVPPGYRAVAVPNDDHTPPVRVGDRVDVLATFDVADDARREAAPSFAVTSGAEVLATTPRALTLAVDADDAPRVAFALAKGAVTIAVRGAISGRSRPR